MKAARKLKRELSDARAQVQSLNKKVKKLEAGRQEENQTMDTPDRAAVNLLTELNVSPTQSRIKKVLPVTETNRVVQGANKNVKKQLFAEFSTRKRVKKGIAKNSGVNRKVLGPKKQKRLSRRKAAKEMKMKKVNEFLARPDNSYELSEKKKAGQFSLADTVSNLYLKFKSENLDLKLSRSCFYAYRDKSKFRDVKYTNRNVCLCPDHANMHLMMQSCPNLPKSSTKVAKMTDEEITEKVTEQFSTKESERPKRVRFSRWEKQKIDFKGGQITKLSLVNKDLSVSQYLDLLLTSLSTFRPHCQRVEDIYGELRKLKENLHPNNLIIQIDYAENYAVKYMEEPTEIYFNNKQITVLPMVVYYRTEVGGELKHLSFAGVTDVTSHTAPTTFTFLGQLLRQMKEQFPHVNFVHFVSDSPSSQFRNRTMAHIVAFSEELLDLKTSWTWLEVGHGKGPCDGVGGSLKKATDNAVKGRAEVRDSAEMARHLAERGINIQLIPVSLELVQKVSALMEKWTVKPVDGISSMHSFVGNREVSVMRELPCFSDCCYQQGFMLVGQGWLPAYGSKGKGKAKKTTPEVAQIIEIHDDDLPTIKKPRKKTVAVKSKPTTKKSTRSTRQTRRRAAVEVEEVVLEEEVEPVKVYEPPTVEIHAPPVEIHAPPVEVTDKEMNIEPSKKINIDTYVAITEDGACYAVAQVQKQIEEYYKVSVMTHVFGKTNLVKWGKEKLLIIKDSDILCILSKPQKVKMCYQISDEDLDIIHTKLQEFIDTE